MYRDGFMDFINPDHIRERLAMDMDLNPMISGCFIKVFSDLDGEKLIEELKQYLSENEL